LLVVGEGRGPCVLVEVVGWCEGRVAGLGILAVLVRVPCLRSEMGGMGRVGFGWADGLRRCVELLLGFE